MLHHVWVESGTQMAPTPGLLCEWRRTPAGEFEGRVVMLTGTVHVVQQSESVGVVRRSSELPDLLQVVHLGVGAGRWAKLGQLARVGPGSQWASLSRAGRLLFPRFGVILCWEC